MSYNSKYTGAQVEALLDKVGNTYTKTEADAATTAKINALDVASKGGAGKYIQAISQTDGKISATEASMPTALKNPSAITIQKNGTSIGSYDGSEAKTINISDVASAATLSSHTGNATVHITAAERTKWNKVVTDLAAILGTDSDTIINKWEEVVAFLDTYTEADTLANLLSNKVSKSGGTMTGNLTIETGTDRKLIFNNTDGEKASFISFRENGTEYLSIQGYENYLLSSKRIHAPYFITNSTTLCTNLNADLLDGYHKSSFNSAVRYYTEGSRESGYYKIKIKGTEGWMLGFKILTYQSYCLDEINICGYNYGDSHWYAPSVSLISSQGTRLHNYVEVKFGYDSAWNLWVAIPAHDYTGILITDVVNGFKQVADINNLFEIVYETTLTGTTQVTKTPSRGATIADNVASSTKLETARTLTIGSTGKAFNGTADVSWSLAEIGAAAASHAHTFVSLTGKPTTLSGYGITDAKIANGVITLGGNTITPLTSHQSLANYYTKTETNNQISAAIAAAITQTLNTAV